MSDVLTREGESVSPATVSAILDEEGFSRLPRRGDEERSGPELAEVADVQVLDLSLRRLSTSLVVCFWLYRFWWRWT